MTIHPVQSTILHPLLHLSHNHSINTSICVPSSNSPTHHLCAHHSSVCLSSLYPSIHRHTMASIISQHLQRKQFKVFHMNTGLMLAFQADRRETKERFDRWTESLLSLDSSGDVQNTATWEQLNTQIENNLPSVFKH